MSKQKFNVGDHVRFVREKRATKVISIVSDQTSTFYDVVDYSGYIVHRLPECDLRSTTADW